MPPAKRQMSAFKVTHLLGVIFQFQTISTFFAFSLKRIVKQTNKTKNVLHWAENSRTGLWIPMKSQHLEHDLKADSNSTICLENKEGWDRHALLKNTSWSNSKVNRKKVCSSLNHTLRSIKLQWLNITCFCILPDHKVSCSCFSVEGAKDHRAATAELHNHILSFLRRYDVVVLLHLLLSEGSNIGNKCDPISH